MDQDAIDRIQAAAADPASASGDGQSATSRPLKELIEAEQVLAGQRAAVSGKSPWDMAYRAKAAFRKAD